MKYGPGQIVCYPLLDLHNHKKDLHWYTNKLEELVIETLKEFGIQGERSEVNTGVWIGMNKICAIGVTASRWVTMHGLALNVTCDVVNYERIVPCGIKEKDRGVCRVADFNSSANILEVAEVFQSSFSKAFDLNLETADEKDLETLLHSDYPELAQIVIEGKV